ncbi:MAG: hemolysin family protein [Candidatus Sericytochromatia bacterium]
MDSLLHVAVPIAIMAVLILLNGLFVAAEFAIIGAPKAAIDRRAADGDPLAKRISLILSDPVRQDRFIATAQLGITVASLGLGMYGEHILAEWIFHALESAGAGSWAAAHTLATVLAIAIMTYFHIVVGEMVPKSMALQQAEQTARWITPPMLAIQALFFPLVIGLNGIGNGILKLLGVNRQAGPAEHFMSSEELQFLVEESQEGGMLRPEAGRVVMELFEFGELTAGEVMVPRVAMRGLPLGATAAQLRDVIQIAAHTRYPVYQGDMDHVVGVVHIKDVLRLLMQAQPLHAGMVRVVPRVPGTATLDVVLNVMREARVQLAVVMDEHGGTAGIVTIEDLFDEVAGEIEEGPLEPAKLRLDETGRLHVAGGVRLEEVGEQLNVELADEQVDTVSGLVLMLLNRPPRLGDVMAYQGLLFEVTETENYGVKTCAITRLEDPEPGA